MRILNTFRRITKIFGKAILGLLLFLLIILALIHLPPVQEKITHKVATYLSSKIKASVSIQSINFSILGRVTIEDIAISDPDHHQIFSASEIEATGSIIDFVCGNLNFDEVSISGVDFHLIQGEEGLNIQFILDAFRPSEEKTTTSTELTLRFNRIQLENIIVEFTSIANGTAVDARLQKFTCLDADFKTLPNRISARNIYFQQALIDILSTGHPDTSIAFSTPTDQPFMLDGGLGIGLDIKTMKVEDSDFSFHKNEEITTPKFDPAHISVNNIQINLSDVYLNKDTLDADLHTLSAQMPGFALDEARANIRWNRNQLALSGLHLSSLTNQLDANLSAQYDLNADHVADHTVLEIDVFGQSNPESLAYFFSDSVMNHFNHWKLAEIKVEANYNMGNGLIKTLNLKTRNSQLHAEGKVYDVLDSKKLSWEEIEINSTIGSDFKETLSPYLADINFPQEATLQLTSSGNPKEISVDGNILSDWGDVKVTGQVNQHADKAEVDVHLAGNKVDLGKWINVSMLGPMDLALTAKGNIGNEQNIQLTGLISDMEILDQSIHDITIDSRIKKASSTVMISIDDPNYHSEISSEITFGSSLSLTTHIQLDDFMLGKLLRQDSTLSISGNVQSNLELDQSTLEGSVQGIPMLFKNHNMEYLLDTMTFHTMISPTGSTIQYVTDNEKGELVSNFDIRDSRQAIQDWSADIMNIPRGGNHPTGYRNINFSIELKNAMFFQILGIDIDELSSLRVSGEFNEHKESSSLKIISGNFKGYDASLDSLNINLQAHYDSINARVDLQNIRYGSYQLNHVDLDVLAKDDTAKVNFLALKDTITVVGVQVNLHYADSGTFVYPDKFLIYNQDYWIDPDNPIFMSKNNMVFNDFRIIRNDMQLNMDGDLNNFNLSLRNLDLTPLNFLLSTDTTIINKGHLHGDISYHGNQQINIKANIDSLSLYHSNPLTIEANAESKGNQIPFEFLLTNESNTINLNGQYLSEIAEVDASVKMNVNNLELFSFLVNGFVEDMHGTIRGESTIHGSIKSPKLNGYIHFVKVGLTTINPRLTFNVEDDRITLDNSSLLFNNFTLYDPDHNPFIINGSLATSDYQSFSYDLQLNADQYALINRPDSASGNFKGQLVIDSDMKLKGNNKDTNIEAKLTIKDATKLTIITSQENIKLLKAEGIVEFIDPTALPDSAAQEKTSNYYDSLIASLPHFNLNSTVRIEEDALIRIIIDEQSGDFIETAGGASLELGYDRTGTLRLAGNYTINKGVYRLSFYDLVKKNFTLAKGSSINWSGSPKDGDLNIKAIHTVASNSIGLIGQEIGENEKSIYKRSLDYEIGININGTIEKPVISFSLDLPQNEKVSYPVLANKLDRLKQPEYASELNKQVFGLLVLGGFLPENTGSDINSNTIAATALSNSVNNLLASQLNRFASQYIKNVNIDVGIQSYSDYSTPGGKTQTAMDFRVSKSVMNDRLSFEIGGDFNINQDQSGANTGKNYRGDIAIIYDLTGNGDKQLKLFNNQTYDIIYQEIKNTGISLIFIREFAGKEGKKEKGK